MIHCTYRRDKREIVIEGHANYSFKGTDIVCSAVTALEYTLNAYIEKVRLTDNLPVENSMGDAKGVFSGCPETDEVFEAIWNGLLLIANSYPKYCSCWVG